MTLKEGVFSCRRLYTVQHNQLILRMRTYIHLLFFCLFLAACSADRKQYVIGVSQCSEDNWREKLNGELRQGLYYYDNVNLEIVSADDDDQRQIAQIDSLVDAGIDLLIVSPNQMNTVTDAIDRAYGKGIPVILFDRKTASEKYTAFIGADNYEVGKALGNYVVAQFRGRKANVAEIQGLRGSSPTIERHRGFVDAVKSSPGINIIASRYAGWLQDEARVQMDSILAEHDSINIVFGHNDRMAAGAREAVAGKSRKDSIVYLGVDALASPGGGMEAVRDGKIAASYLYPTRGDLVLQLAMNILEGKPYSKDNYLKATLVTKDNVEQMLMQNEEMELQTERLETAQRKVDSYLTQYNHQKTYLVLVITILLLALVFFVYIYHTIMQKRRMAEEAADAKLQFFTNVSHELRTPLTLIADPVERLLEDGRLSTEQRTLINMVHKNVGVVLRLVREILDFRKAQKGKMPLNVSVFNLGDSLQEWTEVFLPATERHGINLRLDIKDVTELAADYEKVESIVYNLLSNAIKYTPDSGEIVISAVRTGEYVTLKVSDTGAGIPKDSQRYVFDRFFQAGNRNAGGTGIGLAIVKTFTELHGGSVSVVSEEGKGTEFEVRLPVKCKSDTVLDTSVKTDPERMSAVRGMTVERTGRKPAEKLFGMTDSDGERLKVLVVDDNEDVRSYVSSILCGEYDIYEAADGQAGYDKALKEVPDLIICDVMMPVVDGLEMCRRVKAQTATSHVPVILLTAMTQDAQRAEGYDCGADAYITKPFSSKVLVSRVRNLLENRCRLRERYSSCDIQEEQATDADSIFISRLRGKIKENMSAPGFSVETLSAEMGLSRVQLYRKVKALTGSTPVELIRIMRLQRAERLLKSSGKTIAEVSYEVGFSSPSYFTKCFKEYSGKLPGDVL